MQDEESQSLRASLESLKKELRDQEAATLDARKEYEEGFALLKADHAKLEEELDQARMHLRTLLADEGAMGATSAAVTATANPSMVAIVTQLQVGIFWERILFSYGVFCQPDMSYLGYVEMVVFIWYGSYCFLISDFDDPVSNIMEIPQKFSKIPILTGDHGSPPGA